jgi:hypothetical protein
MRCRSYTEFYREAQRYMTCFLTLWFSITLEFAEELCVTLCKKRRTYTEFHREALSSTEKELIIITLFNSVQDFLNII